MNKNIIKIKQRRERVKIYFFHREFLVGVKKQRIYFEYVSELNTKIFFKRVGCFRSPAPVIVLEYHNIHIIVLDKVSCGNTVNKPEVVTRDILSSSRISREREFFYLL